MIKIENLCFSYHKSSTMLLDNINLTIPKGSYLSIVGDNGSCKTTLIKLMLGLLSPNSGSIQVATKKIAYVPQRLENFNSEFPISVFEVLKTHAKALHLNVNEAVEGSLKKVNLPSFKRSLIGNLSGGQQQRVFISRALMGNPELIILDEPSTGVDYKAQADIYAILKRINEECGTNIICIEHNMGLASKYSSHILKIDKGRVCLQSCEEFKNSMPLAGA